MFFPLAKKISSKWNNDQSLSPRLRAGGGGARMGAFERALCSVARLNGERQKTRFGADLNPALPLSAFFLSSGRGHKR